MSDERAIISQIERKLIKLGYPESAIQREVMTRSGERVDLAVFEEDTCRIVIEIKTGLSYPEETDPLKLRFNPTVRKAQFYAKELSALYYVISNGKAELWFTTDDVGRPQLLDAPVGPTVAFKEGSAPLSRNVIKRILQELRDLGYRRLTSDSMPTDSAAIAIYAKLLKENGDGILEGTLADARVSYDRLYSLLPRNMLPSDKLEQRYFADAFDILNRISFRASLPKDVFAALDEVFTDPMGLKALRLPRWLSDFFVRLAHPRKNDIVLDIYTNYGDIAAATLLLDKDVRIWSVSPNAKGFIWTRIQQLILGITEEGAIVGEMPPYDIFSSNKLLKPTCVIVAPPFNVRLDTYQDKSRFISRPGSNGISEELYLELAIDWVQPGGRIIALVPEGVLFAESRRRFREYLRYEAHLRAIIGLDPLLPLTQIRTSVLVIDKPKGGVPDDNVFMARINSFEKPNMFNCQGVPQIAQILDSFKAFTQTGQTDLFAHAWLIPLAQLSLDNFSTDSYNPARPNHQLGTGSTFPMVPLRSIAEIIRGSGLTLAKGGDLPVVGPASIRPLVLDEFSLDRTTRKKLTSNPVMVRTGDVVINAVGPYLGSAAAVSQVMAGMYVSRNVLVIRPQASLVLPEYLAVALNSDYVKQQLSQMATGSVYKLLSVRALQDVAVPLPDLSVQEQIVSKIKKALEDWSLAKKNLSEAENAFKESIRKLAMEGGEQ